ncbi:MAG: glycosyltransferase family 4 protein [Planctomycetota bacterium]
MHDEPDNQGDHHGRSRFAGRSVLIVDQGLAKHRRGKPIHGVELFRLYLVGRMLERGVRVTLVCERSWSKAFDEHGLTGHPLLTPVLVPNIGGVVVNALVGAVRTLAEEHDAILIGNPRKGLVPAMYALTLAQPDARTLVFAHRRGEHRFLDMVQGIDFDLVCVSEEVARKYRGNVSGSIDVMYGLPNHAEFYPPAAPPGDDGIVRCCLLGRLPNVSKGTDKALRALELLDPGVRGRVELHLASYIEEPPDRVSSVPGVVCHRWLRPADVPPFLRTMDAMLTLSSNETFSQAIVQGMLTGLPIVATRIPVYEEKLDTGGGLLAHTPEHIARAITTLVEDPAGRARMGGIARETALERYCWDTDAFLERHLFPER